MAEPRALSATLRGVVPPDENQREGIRAFLAQKYGADQVELAFEADPALISGFKLLVEGEEIDWSLGGRVAQFQRRIGELMQSGGFEDIIPILRSGIDSFELAVEGRESGEVISVGDGIAVIDGLAHVSFGEILLFENGVRGLAQDIRRNEVGCLLLGPDDHVHEGARAVRTGKAAGVPVGRALLGRVLNALGEPADGQGPIDADGYYPVESEAPGILDRQSVSVPMETGILAIDAMFPIGRGQRELIIGDRQTGKTAIALDTILNQKGKGVLCVYVAVGQKASSVARVHGMLKKHGAADYTVVVSACASDPAPLQYIAPYSGCAIAEYFMHLGEDVLIVYDDLSKHAVAYRELSLLLERPPGREAYPGDVFYLHSRLLERSARLSKEKGGGSITALPIVETQAGDVASYIPTNVISITDGQIFLESELFFAGQRPAVSVGLSVSRVGGAAQTKAMKKAAGSIRLDLAQYREIEVFTQFSSDLDEFTREQLDYGAGLMELFKQPQGSPMRLCEQVVSLVAASNKVMLRVPRSRVKEFQREMLAWFEAEHPDICRQIEIVKDLSDDLRGRILESARAFRAAVASKYGLQEAKR